MKKRRRIWLLLLIASLVFISFRGGSVSYGLFFTLLCYPLISYLYLLVVLIQVKVYQTIDSRVITAGTPVRYFFTLQNEGKLPVSGIRVELFSDFAYVQDIPQDAEFELLPGEKYTFETQMICKYRGAYKVGVKKLFLTDFFRVFVLAYPFPGALEAIVSPRVPALEEYGLEEEDERKPQKDTVLKKNRPDVFARDYVEGESLKHIHWKASARMGQLKSRTFYDEESEGLFLYLDTCRVDKEPSVYLPEENTLLELSLLLLTETIQKGEEAAFCFFNLQNGSKEGDFEQYTAYQMRDFDTIYEVTSKLGFQEKQSQKKVLSWFRDNFRDFGQKKVIFVVNHLTEAVLDEVERLRNQDCLCRVYYLTSEIEYLDLGEFDFQRIQQEVLYGKQ